jgi:hypothetical protein
MFLFNSWDGNCEGNLLFLYVTSAEAFELYQKFSLFIMKLLYQAIILGWNVGEAWHGV